MKSIYTAMVRYVEHMFSDVPLDMIGISSGQDTNPENGDVTAYTRVDAEIPKGYDEFSRCQLSVKIPNSPMKITEDEICESDVSVTFSNLIISYINDRKNVYFRADDYDVRKDDN